METATPKKRNPYHEWQTTGKSTGAKPPDADGILFDSPNDDPIDALHGWRVYRRARRVTGDVPSPWVNMKIVSQKSRASSANYWLSWSTKDKRFSRSSSTERTPKAMRDRVAWIMAYYGTGHEYDPAPNAEDYMLEVEAEERMLS